MPDCPQKRFTLRFRFSGYRWDSYFIISASRLKAVLFSSKHATISAKRTRRTACLPPSRHFVSQILKLELVSLQKHCKLQQLLPRLQAPSTLPTRQGPVARTGTMTLFHFARAWLAL